MRGFSDFKQYGITVLVDGVANLPVSLALGGLNQSVTVQADATMVDTSSATIKEVVGQTPMVELPLNGRNAASLVSLVPGTADLTAGNARGSGDAIQSSTFPGADPTAISGARGDGVNYLLDGSGYRDPYTNVNNPFPNPDALMEFNVQTSNYSAEYGRASGAIVSVVTKSGTNELHGTLWEFLRNDVINARNFFSPTTDILKRNQFGFGVGGPIIKDKLFFYANYQGTRLRSIPSSTSTVVPTVAEEQGTFPSTVTNPATGAPFPNNQIPASLISPISQKLFAYLPVPPASNGIVYYSAQDFENENDGLFRLDYNAAHQRISARYSVFDWKLAAYIPPNNIPESTYGKLDSAQYITVSDTYMITPTLVNTASFSYNHNDSATVSAAPFSWCSIGIQMACTGNPPSTELGMTVSGYFRCICLPCRRPSFASVPTAGREHPVDVIDGESVGIVIVANPILQLLVLLVRGVSESIQQIVKSSNAPAVLRRAGQLAARAGRIGCVGIGGQAFLQDDAMLPTVAHIIRVDGLGTDPAQHAGETYRALIFDRRHSHEPVFRIGLSEMPAANTKFVHVTVLPPHGGLQHVVQLRQSQSGGYQQSPPDRWHRAEQSDLKLIDFRWNRALFCRHNKLSSMLIPA